MDVIIQNDGADGTVLVAISPNSNDLITGINMAGTDNKDHLNTKATAIRGDWVHLTGNDNATGWVIVGQRGTWATEG